MKAKGVLISHEDSGKRWKDMPIFRMQVKLSDGSTLSGTTFVQSWANAIGKEISFDATEDPYEKGYYKFKNAEKNEFGRGGGAFKPSNVSSDSKNGNYKPSGGNSDDRNRAFALSYAKDIAVAMINNNKEITTANIEAIYRKFLSWLNE